METTETLGSIFMSTYKNDIKNLENAIEVTKSKGASLRDSVIIVAKQLKISLADADLIVLNSNAWSGKKDQTEELRNKIYQILSSL